MAIDGLTACRVRGNYWPCLALDLSSPWSFLSGWLHDSLCAVPAGRQWGPCYKPLGRRVWALQTAGAPAQSRPPCSLAGPPHASDGQGENYPNELLPHVHSWCWAGWRHRQGRAGGQAGAQLGPLHGQGIKLPSLGCSKSWCLEHRPGCRSLPKHTQKHPAQAPGPGPLHLKSRVSNPRIKAGSVPCHPQTHGAILKSHC